ncbi:MAG: hypothetical protein WCK78_11180 [Paludibacter sp.]
MLYHTVSYIYIFDLYIDSSWPTVKDQGAFDNNSLKSQAGNRIGEGVLAYPKLLSLVIGTGLYFHQIYIYLWRDVLEYVGQNQVCFQSAILLSGAHWVGLYSM